MGQILDRETGNREKNKSGEPFLIVSGKPGNRKPRKQQIRRAIFDTQREPTVVKKPETGRVGCKYMFSCFFNISTFCNVFRGFWYYFEEQRSNGCREMIRMFFFALDASLLSSVRPNLNKNAPEHLSNTSTDRLGSHSSAGDVRI